MQRVCVFCGSSAGANRKYTQLANEVGRILAKRKLTLVYGGGNVGLMGTLANAVLAEQGHVIGVIPQALVALEVAHTGLPDLRIVQSMHERKALMAELADGFIALPGGLGTLEEFFEIVTWQQLGLHHKPCGLLDAERYFDPLLTLLDHAVAERFLRPEHRAMILVEHDVEALLDQFDRYRPQPLEKWIDRSTS